MKILVIDVGGTHVKLLASGHRTPVKIDSGPTLTAARMVRAVKQATKDWSFDVISIGYPGPVVHGRPLHDPFNLGHGWVRFDFERAFGKPVKVINDAALQALGSYDGGRMLFLGLGTGLGVAAIDDGHVDPMEIGHLPYRNGKTYEDYLGIRGLHRLGRAKWERHVHDVVTQLRQALVSDYVVIGGGNAKLLRRLPTHARLGDNANAFLGGFRLWASESARHRRTSKPSRRRQAVPRRPAGARHRSA
jgi:predicted NBD/HSP70 family sugar kinase